MPLVTFNGTRISYDNLGSGEPALLFLPDWCTNRKIFRELAACSSLHRRTLVMDWRGHGESPAATREFGLEGLIIDALAVIVASGVQQVIPVALRQAGWVALELRRRLPTRISKLVLLDWMVFDPPPFLIHTWRHLQSPAHWQKAVDQLFTRGRKPRSQDKISRLARKEAGAFGFEMWSRAARSVSTLYKEQGNPLHFLSALTPSVPVLHLYAQPADPHYLATQQAFAASHPWFRVKKLEARSQFPVLEVPREVAWSMEEFILQPTGSKPESVRSAAAGVPR